MEDIGRFLLSDIGMNDRFEPHECVFVISFVFGVYLLIHRGKELLISVTWYLILWIFVHITSKRLIKGIKTNYIRIFCESSRCAIPVSDECILDTFFVSHESVKGGNTLFR